MNRTYRVWIPDEVEGFHFLAEVTKAQLDEIATAFEFFPCGGSVILI